MVILHRKLHSWMTICASLNIFRWRSKPFERCRPPWKKMKLARWTWPFLLHFRAYFCYLISFIGLRSVWYSENIKSESKKKVWIAHQEKPKIILSSDSPPSLCYVVMWWNKYLKVMNTNSWTTPCDDTIYRAMKNYGTAWIVAVAWT